MVTQEHPLFPAESKILRGREGINLLVHTYCSNSLSFFFPSFLIFPFSYLFFFLNPRFLFPGFQVSNTVVLVVVVPIWLGLFGPAIHSSPNGPTRPLVLLLHHQQAPVSHLFSLGRPGPVCFPWASSALFFTLHYHGLLLNSLGFLGPMTLSLILRVHGLAINPLLSFVFITLGLPRSILTFPHHIMPMVCFFSFSELL